jgi:hypothetical protein
MSYQINIEHDGPITDGAVITLSAEDTSRKTTPSSGFVWSTSAGRLFGKDASTTETAANEVMFDTAGLGGDNITVTVEPPGGANPVSKTIYVAQGGSGSVRRIEGVTRLSRSASAPTDDTSLWPFIRNQTMAIGFRAYETFLDRLSAEIEASGSGFVAGAAARTPVPLERATCILARGTYAYSLLRLATQIFLMCRCGVAVRGGPLQDVLFPDKWDSALVSELDESRRLDRPVTLVDLQDKLVEYLGDPGGRLPYIDRILRAMLGSGIDDPDVIRRYYGLLHARARCPSLLELIWSYWHEEGMLAQSMNAIAIRFQNKRRGKRDPLARLEIDPLRPLNNLLWGYIQNEYARLSVVRRAYEYDHHYGLTLQGKAVPTLETADSRSKFLEAFHDLLAKASAFYRADADTTVIADAFPVLNALKDLHLILAEGAHNQYADLPTTARTEMLIEQWLLARPEMRDFLGGRAMVPYAEGWMGQVDTMKRMQGWNQTSVTHFRDLGVFGEQLLLSVRFGDWSEIFDEAHAKNWARYWKPEVQGYVHAYRAVTGVDLAAEPTGEADLQRRRALPAALIAQRSAIPAMPLPAAE